MKHSVPDLSDDLPAALARLRDHSTLKVWSVLVTLFGDYAPDPGTYLSGPTLALLTGRIGIRPEALRVALHRLRKDGWIDTAKSGRVSHYSLSPSGREQTLAAHARVYGAQVPPRQQWSLAVAPPDAAPALPGEGAVALGRGLFLVPDGSVLDSQYLMAGPVAALGQDWLQDAIIAPDLQQAHAQLLALLEETWPDPATLPPLDRAALRLLILHNWRRIALRTSPAAEAAMGPDWVGARCRERVANCLADLPRSDYRSLDAAA